MDKEQPEHKHHQTFGIPTGARLHRRFADESVPEGAVRVSPREINEKLMKMMTAWSPASDMYALKHGAGVTGAGAAISGFIFNQYYRSKLNLGKYALLSSFAPACVVPAFLSMLTHHLLVTTPVMMNDFDCPLCAELRAGSIQVLAGVAQPWALAMFSSFSLARRASTSFVPVTRTEAFNFAKELAKPLGTRVGLLVGLNFALAMLVTQEEGRSASKLWAQLEATFRDS